MAANPVSEDERKAWRERVLPPVSALGGGVWSIPVPIPDNPLQYTLVYLLESDRGPVLVDTGWDDPSGYDRLAEGIRAAGAQLSDVHGVLITHCHPDHHGLSGRVREESGAWIAMHGAEAEVVRHMREIPEEEWGPRMLEALRGAGLPDDYTETLRSLRGRPSRHGVPRDSREFVLANALPDRELVHGESAGVPGRELKVVWTPGHTPGHVCLYLDEPLRDGGPRNRLLSGDHLLPTISPQISLYPDDAAEDTDALGDFLDSLERIAALDPAEILPAHQYRFNDAPARVAALLDHHARRLAELRSALLQRPLTLWECAQSMHWNRPWDELSFFARHMALSEAAAHLRRLVKTGLAEAASDGDPILYRAA